MADSLYKKTLPELAHSDVQRLKCLPADITSLHSLDYFAKKLKTFLYRQAYGYSAN